MIKETLEKGSGQALVLSSGGMDSTTLLYYAVNLLGAKNVVAACTYYGQKHAKEIEYSRYQSQKLGVEFHEIDLSSVFSFNKDSSALLSGSHKEIDHISYDQQMEEKLKEGKAPISNAYVPFRNGLFISYATALAMQFHCQYVLYGAHSDDAMKKKGSEIAAYPDCTKKFIDAMSNAVFEGTAGEVQLIAPLWNKTKTEVAQFGVANGMTKDDFKHTWSCYEGKDKPCGICGTDRDRIKAEIAIGFTRKELEEEYAQLPDDLDI